MTPAQSPTRATAVATPVVTAVVGVVVVGAIGALAGADPTEHGGPPALTAWLTTIAVLLAQCVALVVLPRAPRLALAVVAGLPIVIAVATPSALFTASAIPVLVGAFMLGLLTPFRRAAPGVIAAAVLVAAGQFADGTGVGRTDLPALALESAGQAIIVVGLPILLASAIAANRAAARSRQTALDALVRERDAQVGEAIARERSAMARELHDIAAHHLSGISLMASAIARQVTTDPETAREGALQVRAQSNAVLDDLRSLVGLLREAETRDGRGPADQALKTLATVSELVAGARRAGARIELDLRIRDSAPLGEGISPLAQLAAYRMVQESLTNAARHAPGSLCTVVVDDSDASGLVVTVRNSATTASPAAPAHRDGFGLVGMRERSALIGGSFEAGPTREGGWETRMRIPREPGRSEQKEQR